MKKGIIVLLLLGILLVSIISISFVFAENNLTENNETESKEIGEVINQTTNQTRIEPETKPEPEPIFEPEQKPIIEVKICAVQIKITSEKDTYYVGDYGKIVIEIFDSQGNHLPHYTFYGKMYTYNNGMWHTPQKIETDANGYYYYVGKVDESQVGKTKHRIYTLNTGDYARCTSVEDTIEVEVLRRQEIKPVCGNGICEQGEGEICMGVMIACKEGEKCEVPEPDCKVACPQDCGQETIFAEIGERFKLKINQNIKFKEDDNLELKLNNILVPRCVVPVQEEPKETTTFTSITGEVIETQPQIVTREVQERRMSGITSAEAEKIEMAKCTETSPYAVIEVKGKGFEMFFKIGMGEEKIITPKESGQEPLTLTFLDYDRGAGSGVFIVEKGTPDYECPENCVCDPNGNTVRCWTEEECPTGTILCPDGTCRERCEITEITTECKFGCFYGDKCLPIGVRVEGLYCSIKGDLLTQIQDGVCENNFECESNVCVSGECISKGLMKKIISWFKNLFGGE